MRRNRRMGVHFASAAAVAVLLAAWAPAMGQSTWNANAGNWSDGNNWIGGIPDALGAAVIFGQPSLTGTSPVSVDGNFTVGSITFASDAAGGYVVDSAAGSLTFDALLGNALVTYSSAQAGTLGAAWRLADDLTITATTNNTLTLSPQAIANTDGNFARTLTIDGAGMRVNWTASDKDMGGLDAMVVNAQLYVSNIVNAFGSADAPNNPAIVVSSGGRLTAGAGSWNQISSAINADVTVEAGAVLEIKAAYLNGEGTITLSPGAILDVSVDAYYGYSQINQGTQFTTADLPEDLAAVRIRGAYQGDLISSISPNIPIEISGGIGPASLNGHHVTTLPTADQDSGVSLTIGSLGATLSARAGGNFKTRGVVSQTDANSLLQIGSGEVIDGVARTGNVYLYSLDGIQTNNLYNVRVSNGAGLYVGNYGRDAYPGLLNGDPNVAVQIELAGATLQVGHTSTDDVIDWGDDLTVTGTSTLRLVANSAAQYAGKEIAFRDLTMGNVTLNLTQSNVVYLGIDGNIVLDNAGSTIDVYGAGTVFGQARLHGQIQSGRLIKTGAGSMILDGENNTFAGGIDILGGNFYADGNYTLGSGPVYFHGNSGWDSMYLNAAQGPVDLVLDQGKLFANAAGSVTGNTTVNGAAVEFSAVAGAVLDANLTLRTHATLEKNAITGASQVTYLHHATLNVAQDYSGGTVFDCRQIDNTNTDVLIYNNNDGNFAGNPLGSGPVTWRGGDQFRFYSDSNMTWGNDLAFEDSTDEAFSIGAITPANPDALSKIHRFGDLTLTAGTVKSSFQNGHVAVFDDLVAGGDATLATAGGGHTGTYYFDGDVRGSGRIANNGVMMTINGANGDFTGTLDVLAGQVHVYGPNALGTGTVNLYTDGWRRLYLYAEQQAITINAYNGCVYALAPGSIRGNLNDYNAYTLQLVAGACVDANVVIGLVNYSTNIAPNSFTGSTSVTFDGTSGSYSAYNGVQSHSGGTTVRNGSLTLKWEAGAIQGNGLGTGEATIENATLYLGSSADHVYGNDIRVVGSGTLQLEHISNNYRTQTFGQLTLDGNDFTLYSQSYSYYRAKFAGATLNAAGLSHIHLKDSLQIATIDGNVDGLGAGSGLLLTSDNKAWDFYLNGRGNYSGGTEMRQVEVHAMGADSLGSGNVLVDANAVLHVYAPQSVGDVTVDALGGVDLQASAGLVRTGWYTGVGGGYAPTVTVSGGTELSVAGIVAESITVQAGGRLTLRGASITVSEANSMISLSGTQALDVLTNELKIRNITTGAQITQIETWVSTGAIYSSDTDPLKAVGAAYRETGADANTYVIKATWRGDATLDGSVTGADLAALATNWNLTSGATWSMGDFNGDGAVTGADLAALATNWNKSLAPVGGGAVPEPATVALLALGAVALIRRRRK